MANPTSPSVTGSAVEQLETALRLSGMDWNVEKALAAVEAELAAMTAERDKLQRELHYWNSDIPIMATAQIGKPNTDTPQWVIYNSDYGQFWGPNSGGYFGLWGAGLYTKAEADSLASNRDRQDRVQHISEYRDQISNMRGAFERLSRALGKSAAARPLKTAQDQPCRTCGGYGFVAQKQFIDDGFGEVDTCPTCNARDDQSKPKTAQDFLEQAAKLSSMYGLKRDDGVSPRSRAIAQALADAANGKDR